MPRKPRFVVPGVPLHIVQRGRNRDAVFFEDADYLEFRRRMGEAARKYECALHAYCLMTNHVHLLLTPMDTVGVSRFMQYVGRHYVPYVNHKYGNSGSIWEGRYKASLVDAETYLLACMRYIELNPVAADMVPHARMYRWSSYASNAGGDADTLLTPHDVYLRLGLTESERQRVYDKLFSAHQDSLDVTARAITAAAASGTPLGDQRFQEQIERALGTKVGQASRGRPKGYVMAPESKRAIGRAVRESNASRKQCEKVGGH